MVWQVEIGDKANNQLAALDPVVASRILGFLRTRLAQASHPRQLGEPLRGSLLGEFWRYRTGGYRIIVMIEDAVLKVIVVEIAHRREVYR